MAFEDNSEKATAFNFSPGFGQFLLGDKARELLGRYTHQQDALKFVKAWFTATNEVCTVVLPTGSGKSGVATSAPYVLGAKKCLVISPKLVITKQLVKDFCGKGRNLEGAFIVKRGFVSQEDFEEKFRPSRFIVSRRSDVASRDSVSDDLTITNAHKFPNENTWQDIFPMEQLDLVIVDEAHHFPSSFWSNVVDLAKTHNKKVLFVTATPFRLDGKSVVQNVAPSGGNFGDQYGNMRFFHLSIRDAIQKGVIREPVPHFIELIPDVPGLNDEQFKDLTEGEKIKCRADIAMMTRMHELLINKDEHASLPSGVKHRGMIMAKNTPHANLIVKLAKKFVPGLNVRAFHGKVSRKDLISNKYWFDGEVTNKTNMHRFTDPNNHTKALRVLVVVDMLREGYDHPPISVLGVAQHTKSAVKLYQFFGRGLRICQQEVTGSVKCDVLMHVHYKLEELFDKCINEQLIAEDVMADPVEEIEDYDTDEDDMEIA